MVDHDKNVGKVLKTLDDLGMADNTFVMYTTDNGPHMNSWPDGGTMQFRSEKNSNWEGAYRVSGLVRWPGNFQAAALCLNGSSRTRTGCRLSRGCRRDDIKEKLLKGSKSTT